jgi:hypothetical protein
LTIDPAQLGKLQTGLEQTQEWLGKATELISQPVPLLQLQRLVRSSRELFVLVEEVRVQIETFQSLLSSAEAWIARAHKVRALAAFCVSNIPR